MIEEIWEKHSQHIDEDLNSLETVAGKSVMTRQDFVLAMKSLRAELEPLLNAKKMEAAKLKNDRFSVGVCKGAEMVIERLEK